MHGCGVGGSTAARASVLTPASHIVEELDRDIAFLAVG
jgi:hypothetical protein